MKTFGPIDPALLQWEEWEEWTKNLDRRLLDLDAAFEEFKEIPSARIASYILAISSIRLALRERPEFTSSLAPLEDLARRLDALSAGQKSALDATPSKKGRPPRSTLDCSLVGRAAATVELLIKAEHTEPDANKLVAKVAKKQGYRGRGKELSANTIRDWRSSVTGVGSNAETRSAFLDWLRMFRSLGLDRLEKRELRKMVPGMLSPFGAARLSD